MAIEFDYRIYVLEDVIHYFLAKHDKNVVEELVGQGICLEDLEERTDDICSALSTGFKWVRTESVGGTQFAIFECSQFGCL